MPPQSEPLRFWRLPWRFDGPALQADLQALEPGRWQGHFNTGYHDGGWSGLALISGDGDARRLYADPNELGPGRATALLAQCPALRAVLDGLPFQIQSARLLKLAAGSHIREHRDHDIGLDAGSVRLHVPVTTAPGVEFYLDGVRVPMAVGECWYLDFGLPHRVQNRGTRERVHLVIDCIVDERLRAMLPAREEGELLLRSLARESAETSQQRFERFRALVLQRPDLQAELRTIERPDELFARVTHLGAESGLDFTDEDVRSAMQAGKRSWSERHALLALPAAEDLPASEAAAGLEGWIPVLARPNADSLCVELVRVGAQRFTAPFFEDSIAAGTRAPFHSIFRRRLDIVALEGWLQNHPGLPPAGFVFHMSRCGSTLLSQVLAESPANRVMSEAGPVDAALRAGPRAADDPQRGRWLRSMLGMLGQPGSADEQRLFVKFDSWHASMLPLVRRTYPEVPWVFLVRDPVEVIVSHLRRTGAQMVPGMLGFTPPGVDLANALTMAREEYCARVLGAICEAASAEFERDPALGLVVDYADLRTVLHDVVLPHLGLSRAEAGQAAVATALHRDAKNPAFEFEPDAASKQREASDAVRRSAERWVLPAYRRLKERAARPRVGARDSFRRRAGT